MNGAPTSRRPRSACAAATALANAIFDAIGKRVRSLPITIAKLL